MRSVDYGIEFLSRWDGQPFFLAIGLFRPHMPFHVPPKYFAEYPETIVEMPRVPEDDLIDIPTGGLALLKQKAHFMRAILDADARHPGTWREAVRSYQASCTFADHQLGRLLDALGRSEHAKSTIVVLWSDHGYHLGEKNHWEKFALWEKSTRVPLIILALGTTEPGTVVETPVSLLDVYPTLLELAGLPPKPELDGESLAPLLTDPKRERAVSMTYQRGNHAVRSNRWRYIRYADGSEELYDHRTDPDEIGNLATDAQYRSVIGMLRPYLPRARCQGCAGSISMTVQRFGNLASPRLASSSGRAAPGSMSVRLRAWPAPGLRGASGRAGIQRELAPPFALSAEPCPEVGKCQ